MKNLSLFYAFFILVLGASVLGYGVASDYLEENTMIVEPGETRVYNIELQNTEETKINMAVDLESEIARIEDKQETYVVGGDTPIQKLKIIIDVPRNAEPGQEYKVGYVAYPIKDTNSAISLNVQFSRDFTVRVKEGEKKESNVLAVLIAIGIIAVLALVIFLIFKKNKSLLENIAKK